MKVARESTAPSGDKPDERTDFDVYLDLARILKCIELGPMLEKMPISEARRQEVIAAEAYALAQPAHLKDASIYEPLWLDRIMQRIPEASASQPRMM